MPPGDGLDPNYRNLAAAMVRQAAVDLHKEIASNNYGAALSISRWLQTTGVEWAEQMGIDRNAFLDWVKHGCQTKRSNRGANQYAPAH